jgi:hypothetical protein
MRTGVIFERCESLLLSRSGIFDIPQHFRAHCLMAMGPMPFHPVRNVHSDSFADQEC